MKLSFHGAARTVTGSKHLLTLKNGTKILLDCGMFQGMGADTMPMNNDWGFEPDSVDHVILSHAHIDHVGLLPKLVKEGFKGKIYCTPPTEALAKILLIDSAHIQESDVRYANKKKALKGTPAVEPLYTEEDVLDIYPQFVTIPYNEEITIDKDIKLLFTDCGHILGSAAVNLTIIENNKPFRITFSGDVGRYRDMILRSPSPFPQADHIIIESTYGNKLHEETGTSIHELLRFVIDTCIKKKGKLIIPSFSVGRTQELLYLFNRMELEGILPQLTYYVDSPLSVKATEIIKNNPECFNKEVQHLLKSDKDIFSFKGLKYVPDAKASMALNDDKEPCVIISASGMAEAGRVKHHIAHNIGNRRNTILIVGYCEPHSLGGKLMHGASEVNIFGTKHAVEAEIGLISSMSAHGDYEDLCQWLGCQAPEAVQSVYIVHGEYENQVPFRERLMRKGFRDVNIPDLHQTFTL